MGSDGLAWKRTVETVLERRVVGRVEDHADALETVVVLRLKGGRAACGDGASLERTALAQQRPWTKMKFRNEPWRMGIATPTRGVKTGERAMRGTHQADLVVDGVASGGALSGDRGRGPDADLSPCELASDRGGDSWGGDGLERGTDAEGEGEQRGGERRDAHGRGERT